MLQKFSDRIYYLDCDHRSDRPALGYVRGDRLSLMYDCGASPAHVGLYMEALDSLGLRRPGLAVLSHCHWDHSFGACAVEAPVIASRPAHERLRQMEGWGWNEEAMALRLQNREETLFGHHMMHAEYPDCRDIRVRTADIVFDGVLTLDLGGVTCRLLHVGGPHSNDGVLCHVPEEGFLFLGDSHGKDLYGKPWFYDPERPGLLLEEIGKVPYDLQKLARYRAQVQDLCFTHCLPGHADTMTAEEFFRVLQP